MKLKILCINKNMFESKDMMQYFHFMIDYVMPTLMHSLT